MNPMDKAEEQSTPDSGESAPKGKTYNRKERRQIEQEWARRDRRHRRKLYRQLGGIDDASL